MLHNNNQLGQVLTAREMKKVWGGAGPGRKNVCVICRPGNIHCASVPSTAQCDVFDFVPAPPGEPSSNFVNGWMGCKNGSEEGSTALDYTCPNP